MRKINDSKLSLHKKTLRNLNEQQQSMLAGGGGFVTYYGTSCGGTSCGGTCVTCPVTSNVTCAFTCRLTCGAIEA